MTCTSQDRGDFTLFILLSIPSTLRRPIQRLSGSGYMDANFANWVYTRGRLRLLHLSPSSVNIPETVHHTGHAYDSHMQTMLPHKIRCNNRSWMMRGLNPRPFPISSHERDAKGTREARRAIELPLRQTPVAIW
jgi:hypothetical protein